jgi:hypothetical protein
MGRLNHQAQERQAVSVQRIAEHRQAALLRTVALYLQQKPRIQGTWALASQQPKVLALILWLYFVQQS